MSHPALVTVNVEWMCPPCC